MQILNIYIKSFIIFLSNIKMLTPRGNKYQSQSKINPEQKYQYKSPQARLINKSPRKQLSPNNFDTKSQKSHHSRKSGRSAKSNASYKSFETLYSRHMLNKFEKGHTAGYSQKQIKQSIDFIFEKYDDNRNDLLQKNEVLQLVRAALKHIGSRHQPTQLEIAQFIQHVDKNNDGQLSRQELHKAFLRAGKSLN